MQISTLAIKIVKRSPAGKDKRNIGRILGVNSVPPSFLIESAVTEL
jgi:hypothetical protein